MVALGQIAASGLSDMRCAHSAHCLSARSRGQSPLLEHCHLLAPARASCACGFALIAAYDDGGLPPVQAGLDRSDAAEASECMINPTGFSDSKPAPMGSGAPRVIEPWVRKILTISGSPPSVAS